MVNLQGKVIEKRQQKYKLSPELYAKTLGRAYTKWISSPFGVGGASRTNGRAIGTVIETPPYIIESIIRDEMRVERNLVASSLSISGTDPFNNTVTCNGTDGYALSDVDDYYKGAIMIVSVINGASIKTATADVSAYNGTTKTFSLYYAVPADWDTATPSNNRIYLTNVNPSYVDYASFDVIGNTTNGTRKDWRFKSAITDIVDTNTILDELAFESWCMLHRDGTSIKLIDLDSASGAITTFNSPLHSKGSKACRIEYSSPGDVYSEFNLEYFYDFGSAKYKKNRKISPLVDGGLGSAYQDKCKSAESFLKKQQVYEYQANWIYDETTMDEFSKRVVNHFTSQHAIVTYYADIKNHIQYDIGDKVLINVSEVIPPGVNNSVIFMITNKEIQMNHKDPYIKFTLTELKT